MRAWHIDEETGPILRWLGISWSAFWLVLVTGLLLPILAVVRAATFLTDPDRIGVGRWFRIGGSWVARGCPFWRFQLEGAMPRDGRAYLVVANHNSMVDIPSLCLLCTDGWEMKWIVKRELFRVPWLGWLLRLAGDIPVVRGNVASGVEASRRTKRLLKRGIPVMVFPEATRSRNGVMGRFHPGSFHVAIELDIPILPIAIQGTADCIAPSGAPRPAQINLRVLPPVETAARKPISAITLANEIHDLLERAVRSPYVVAYGPEPLLGRDQAQAAREARASGGLSARDGLAHRDA